jgi:hypothetical protein
MIDQNEITYIFRVFADRKLWMPDLRCLCILEPIVGYVVRHFENHTCSWRIDRLPVTVPIL